MEDFSFIKHQRRELHLTQKELAEKANVSQSFIAKVESGLLNPSYERITRLTNVLEKHRAATQPTAGTFVVKNISTCTPQDSVKTVIARMRKQAISQVPVIQEQVIVGLVTETGLLEHLLQKDPSALIVKEVMQAPPPIIDAQTPRDAVLSLLKHAPIVAVTKNGKLHGIITRADIIRGAYR